MRWHTRFGSCIYTSPSGYKVYENYVYRWLTLDSNVLQTMINKKKPHQPILYYLPALTLMARSKPGESCILGLGGAGAVQMLANLHLPITAVDNSAEIIEIAQNYFMIAKVPQLTIVHQSAELFLEQNTTQYAHLLVDLYNAHSFPDECNNEDFFLQCKSRLKKDGFLAVNLANTQEQHALLQLIKQHFSNTLVIPIKRCANMVIIASNHAHEVFIDAVLSSKEVKKIELIGSWGCVAG